MCFFLFKDKPLICRRRQSRSLWTGSLFGEKNSKERKGKVGWGGEAFSLFPLPSSPLDQRPVHRLTITWKAPEPLLLYCNTKPVAYIFNNFAHFLHIDEFFPCLCKFSGFGLVSMLDDGEPRMNTLLTVETFKFRDGNSYIFNQGGKTKILSHLAKIFSKKNPFFFATPSPVARFSKVPIINRHVKLLLFTW